MLADVPLAASLSGGIDSSLIVATAASLLQGTQLTAFTASFQGFKEDETPYARSLSKSLGIQLVEVPVTSRDILDYMNRVVAANDYPLVHSSTIAQYKIAEKAKLLGFKVLLDGQGGDELFGGYENQVANFMNQLIKDDPRSVVRFIQSLEHAPVSLKWLIRYVTASFSQNFYSRKYYLEMIVRKNGLQTLIPQSDAWFAPKNDLHDPYHLSGSFNAFLSEQTFGGGLKNLLRWADRNGMANHIEGRFPLADDLPLLEFMFSLPASYKIHGG
jgi:asparagine synthase (glutamine-hydrolysing)